MKYVLLSLIVLVCFHAGAQPIRNFRVKTGANEKERTQMLDLLRNSIKNNLEQDVVFVVNHFNVSDTYAWMEGSVQRKDGKPIVFPDEAYDCCHVEALFKKVKNSWVLKAEGAFSTDVWYSCLINQYPDADLRIFSEFSRQAQISCN